MVATAKKRATYEDVQRAPRHLVAELLSGVLYTSPRPRLRHARAASVIDRRVGGPYGDGIDGPGGWIILPEPELHLGPEPDILVPDLAGWRRERMPTLADDAFATLAPDWVCEVLSPSTEDVDRAEKMPIYARERVSHAWLVDPAIKTLEIFRLDGDTYRLITTFRGDAKVRAEPFDAVELSLASLWVA